VEGQSGASEVVVGQVQRGEESAEVRLEALQKRLREVTFLQETGQVLAATLDRDSVLKSLMILVRDYFKVEAASTALWDEQSDKLVFRAAVGQVSDSVVGFSVAADYGVAGHVLRTGETVEVSEPGVDSRWYSGVDAITGFSTRRLLAVPIAYEGRTIGVVEVLNPPEDVFDDDVKRLLPAVASIAAVAIRNAQLYERVLQAESQYEYLFNSSQDAVVVLDLDGRALDLNEQAAKLFGLPRDHLVGVDFWTLMGIGASAKKTIVCALDKSATYSLEIEIEAGDEIRTLETHFSKIGYGTRDAIQWVGHDVSERVALEKMRKDMTDMIVHDLRNPLGSIISSLQLLRTAVLEGDTTLPVDQLLSIGLLSGHKMHRLIDSLLDIGRLEAEDIELRRDWVSPRTLVTEAVEQVQPLALNRQQELSMEAGSDLPDVNVEYDMIARVLTNLLDNAIKFTPRKGHIGVYTKLEGDSVVFTVSDSGAGVLPADRERIFERFTRLDTGQRTQGTGLGLAFCKLAVEAHGGRIWVDGAPEGGADFHFSLLVETS